MKKMALLLAFVLALVQAQVGLAQVGAVQALPPGILADEGTFPVGG